MEYSRGAPTRILQEFSRRTLANLGELQRIHDATNERAETEAPFIVTAKLGVFLSIVLLMRNEVDFIQQHHAEALDELADALIDLAVDPGAGRGSKDQIIAFRNAVGHGHLDVMPDEAKKIGTIIFSHEKNTWKACLTPEQLDDALRYVETFVSKLGETGEKR